MSGYQILANAHGGRPSAGIYTMRAPNYYLDELDMHRHVGISSHHQADREQGTEIYISGNASGISTRGIYCLVHSFIGHLAPTVCSHSVESNENANIGTGGVDSTPTKSGLYTSIIAMRDHAYRRSSSIHRRRRSYS